MYWKFITHILSYLPIGEEVSYTRRIFGCLLVVSAAALCLGYLLRRRWLTRFGAGFGVSVLLIWGCLYLARPPWLRIAGQSLVPLPTFGKIDWTTRAPGLDTADLDLHVNDEVVDHVVFVRLDPRYYKFSVHYDPTGSRTAEDWQRELGATVVVNGSYFGQTNVPLTPLRSAGKSLGPADYQSDHGAFVTDGSQVAIIDLRQKDVLKAIAPYADAMVSYPLLIDANGGNRARETKVWLASRNFIGIDNSGRVVIGTTQTGFFTLHRLGEFLKKAPLGLRVALNFDGGPLVSQVVQAGGFSRQFHGKAEMTNDTDVLRALWHAHVDPPSPLPIVLVAMPVQK
jgi:hypothetical protein